MNTYGICFDKELEFLYVVCPLCYHIGNEDDSHYQYNDYVTHHMIWCEKCDARIVTNIAAKNETFEDYQVVDYETIPQQFRKPLKKVKKASEDYDYVKIPLMKIHKVINFELERYKYTGEHKDTEDNQTNLKRFIDSKFKDKNCGFDLRPEKEKIIINEKSDFDFDNVGLTIDSYNAADGKKYGLDMSHDGIYVHLQCEDVNGNLCRAAYWGD